MEMHETLHAAPRPGEDFSPCCGRRLTDLPRYDRITLKPELVTCARLTDAEMMLLSGQPVVMDAYDRQITFMMTATVCHLLGDTVTTAEARAKVDEAIRQIVPCGQPIAEWTSELIVRVTTRAEELVRF
jgi:hypothetical protein